MTSQQSTSSDVDSLAAAIRTARSIVVLTGAGISTASGIPDFRGPQGVWTRNPGAEKLATLHNYMSDPEVRQQAWRLRLEHPAWTAEPNAAHRALVDLERKANLDALITQNVDGLHQKAGSSDEFVIEIHGSLRQVVCMSCSERAPMERALERVIAGEVDPPCRTCGGILKSATISFGQNLVEADLARCYNVARRCDLLIAAGTSLTVQPVAYLPGVAKEAGARLAILNQESTPYDSDADWVMRSSLVDSLPEVVGVI
jgi:NAD-dependent deacetylase